MEFSALWGAPTERVARIWFCQVVDGEVTLIIGDLVVMAKDKHVFYEFYAQLLEEFPVNEMGYLY